MGFGKCESILVAVGLTAVISFAFFISSNAFADSVIDDVVIDLPISCTISGTGMDSHNTTLRNGNYEPNIGTTTMHVYCNDLEGFSIYAAGFSGDVYGETNSNKLIGTSFSDYATISTGTNTGPVGGEDVSSWAMKLATDSGATYPLNILSDTEGTFTNYHAVPLSFTKVATRLSSTDAGTGAVGSSLTSTYAAYVSGSQPADTYTGKVVYVLVHPNYAPAPETLVKCPNNQPCIRIASPPDKTDYDESEPVDLTGIDVVLYDDDGAPIKHLDENDLTFSPTTASSQLTLTSKYGVTVDKAGEYLGAARGRVFTKYRDGVAIAFFRNGSSVYSEMSGPVLISLTYSGAQKCYADVGGPTSCGDVPSGFRYHGVSLSGLSTAGERRATYSSPLPYFQRSRSDLSWSELAEELGIEIVSNTITVTYEDPDSGKILQDTFTVNVED